MMPLWVPQKNEKEAQVLAELQLKEFGKVSPRRNREAAFIREPTAAAWIVTLAPDARSIRPHIGAIERVLVHYDYKRLHYCTFFWIEAAWQRLAALR
jgi:hypothetical protein